MKKQLVLITLLFTGFYAQAMMSSHLKMNPKIRRSVLRQIKKRQQAKREQQQINNFFAPFNNFLDQEEAGLAAQQAALSVQEDTDLGINILFGEDNSDESQEIHANTSFFARHKLKFGLAGAATILGGALFAGYKYFTKKKKEESKDAAQNEEKAKSSSKRIARKARRAV